MKSNNDNLSLVSCIMPTYANREFVSQTIEYFLYQDFDKKELIIVDDGDEAMGNFAPLMSAFAIFA